MELKRKFGMVTLADVYAGSNVRPHSQDSRIILYLCDLLEPTVYNCYQQARRFFAQQQGIKVYNYEGGVFVRKIGQPFIQIYPNTNLNLLFNP